MKRKWCKVKIDEEDEEDVDEKRETCHSRKEMNEGKV